MRVIALIACLLLGIVDGQANSITSAPSSPGVHQDSAELTEAKALSASAVSLYNAEKYEKALDPAKRALSIRERALGSEDPLVLESVATLATVQFALKNFKEAERLYKRVLAAHEKTSGTDSLKAAATWDALAWLHYANGDAGQAESDLKRALAIREKTLGLESKEVARTLFKLGQLYQFQDEPRKALQIYERIVASHSAQPASVEILKETSVAYACLLRKSNKADEAEELEKHVRGTHDPPVSKGVLNGLALKVGRPAYPAMARSGRVSATVGVRVTISEEGKVVHACAESGNRLFWQTSEAAAYGSEFAPTILNGKPVRVTGVITYNYVAQ